jgi:hypothetical protein
MTNIGEHIASRRSYEYLKICTKPWVHRSTSDPWIWCEWQVVRHIGRCVGQLPTFLLLNGSPPEVFGGDGGSASLYNGGLGVPMGSRGGATGQGWSPWSWRHFGNWLTIFQRKCDIIVQLSYQKCCNHSIDGWKSESVPIWDQDMVKIFCLNFPACITPFWTENHGLQDSVTVRDQGSCGEE